MADRTEQVRIDLTANDDASKTIDDVADAADKLERKAPEVDVKADTSNADKGLGEVDATATRLDKNDVVIAIRAQIDDLKTQAKEAQTTLDALDEPVTIPVTVNETGDGFDGVRTKVQGLTEDTGKAQETMHGFIGNAVSEIPGLGAAFGPAAEAMGQLTEGILGGEVAMEGLIAAALPIAGITALVKLWNDEQERVKAIDAFNKKKVDDYTTAIRNGKTALEGLREEAEKTQKLEWVDTFGKVKDLGPDLQTLGITFDQFVTAVGKGKPGVDALFQGLIDKQPELSKVLDDLTDNNLARLQGATDRAIPNSGAFINAWRGVNQAVDDTTTATGQAMTAEQFYGTTHARVSSTAKRNQDIVTASFDLTKIAIQGMKDELADEQVISNFQDSMIGAQNSIKENGRLTTAEIINVKTAIIDAGTTAGLTPIEIKSEIDKVTPTDVNTAFIETQQLIDRHGALKMQAQIQATIDAEIKSHSGARFGLGPDGILIPIQGSAPPASSAPATIVNVNMPAGSRGVDVVRQVSGQARRSGRRYGAPVVRAAR